MIFDDLHYRVACSHTGFHGVAIADVAYSIPSRVIVEKPFYTVLGLSGTVGFFFLFT